MISIWPGGDCLEKLVDNAVVPGQHCCRDRVSILWLRDLNAVGEWGVTTQLMSSFETILRNHVSVLWAVLRLENFARNALTSDLLYVEADGFSFILRLGSHIVLHYPKSSDFTWIYITDSCIFAPLVCQVILASNLPETLLDLFLGFQGCRLWNKRGSIQREIRHVLVKGGEFKLDSRFFARLLWFWFYLQI